MVTSVVIAFISLVVSGLAMFFTGEHVVQEHAQGQADITNKYLRQWNSPDMLKQRKILAEALYKHLFSGPQKGALFLAYVNSEKGRVVYIDEKGRKTLGKEATSSQCNRHRDVLRPKDLSSLYHLTKDQDPGNFDDFVDDDANNNNMSREERSALESVRSFFENLGAAYHAHDFNEHNVFESFSLPSEVYWTVAVSGWLNGWLQEPKKNNTTHPDREIGSEFRDFECHVEQIERKDLDDDSQHQWRKKILGGPTPTQKATHSFNWKDIELVLNQDRSLPVTIPHEGSMTFRPRIPTDYFVTKGTGESNQGIPPDPYETFSYDMALRQAEIEDFNVVPYTSVLPSESREISMEEARPLFHHGAVLEVIMAKAGGIKGQTVCAGIGRAWAWNTKREDVGGYAAEYEYVHSSKISLEVAEQDARKQLKRSLDHELLIRRFTQNGKKKITVACIPIKKKYGMALTALGFVKFIFPSGQDAIPSR